MSVVIPTFQRAPLIAETVETVLVQSWSPIEVIVVDDGSTDGTVDLLRLRFGDAIRIERLPAQVGISSARNRGWTLARHELVAFCDSDDLWRPDKLARQVPLFEDRAVALVHGWIEAIDASGALLRRRTADMRLWFERAGRRGYDYAGLTETWCMMWPSTVVVRRSLLDSTGGFDPALPEWEDWDLFWRIALDGRVSTVNEVVASYRIHAGNTSTDLVANASAWLTVNRGHIERLRGRPDVARRRQAQRNLYVNMALGHHWLGERAAARRWMLKALALDPRLGRQARHPVVGPIVRAAIPGAPMLARRGAVPDFAP